jgi:hypothetical protein
MEGAAAIVFGFSFLGFFASRLPRCSPLGMRRSSVFRSRHIIEGSFRCIARTLVPVFCSFSFRLPRLFDFLRLVGEFQSLHCL